MANTGNQKEKLLCLLALLQNETDAQQGLTTQQIIQHLEERGLSAERKAIYRDLEALRNAGFDIRKLPKRPVEYALVRSELQPQDVMMLVDVVQSSPFLTQRKSRQLIRGLKHLVSTRQRASLEDLVHVQGRIHNQSDSVFHSVDRIHEALQNKRKLEFLYYSYNTAKQRVARHSGKRYAVTPIKVVFADNYYYLVAHDASDDTIKTYRVDRMKIAQISDEPATRNATIANYDFGDFAYQRFGMFHGTPACITLRVEAPFMDAIVDRFGVEAEVTKHTQTYALVRVNVQVSPQFFGWIAGLNGGVRIHSPQRLARDYRQWLQQLAKE